MAGPNQYPQPASANGNQDLEAPARHLHAVAPAAGEQAVRYTFFTNRLPVERTVADPNLLAEGQEIADGME